MKNYLLSIPLFLAIFLTSGCKSPESPTFQKLDNVNLSSINSTKTELTANAVFHNPNNINGILTHTNIKVIVNEVEVSEIDQDFDINIPKSSNFSIPINISFNPKEIFRENEGFLKNLLRTWVNDEMKIQYLGTVTIKVLGISFKIPIDHTEDVGIR